MYLTSWGLLRAMTKSKNEKPEGIFLTTNKYLLSV